MLSHASSRPPLGPRLQLQPRRAVRLQQRPRRRSGRPPPAPPAARLRRGFDSRNRLPSGSNGSVGSTRDDELEASSLQSLDGWEASRRAAALPPSWRGRAADALRGWAGRMQYRYCASGVLRAMHCS